jgi:ATP-dependent helicase/nuclease subunit A
MPDSNALSVTRPTPPDHAERSRALDPARSFLVQAPAGSGKTYLLTQRFLRLLAQVEKPEEIVAITFTNAAAAEMRNRILEALEKAEHAEHTASLDSDPESLPALAARALEHAQALGWQILDHPSQLRITTIDAFCRGLALQSPLSWGGLLSGLGGRLDPVENPEALYRRAATRTLELLKAGDSPARQSVETILLWRDNHWKEVEDLIVEMLAGRNRWYQEFVFARDNNWEALRNRLEAPFRRAAQNRLETVSLILDRLPGSLEFALSLARFACESPGKSSPLSLAERAELPSVFIAEEGLEQAVLLEEAVDAYRDLACFLLTAKGDWRKKGGLNVNHGFPATAPGKSAKDRFGDFVEALAEEPGLQTALCAFQQPMPVRYTETEWSLIRHCFTLLRHAAGQLQVVFAETGSVDFTEVAQIALRILAPENGIPSDFALRQADSIRHLLVDEFQDTSRSQHQLLSRLIAAWPEREGRSCFCVGDPMQSIYSFREAEVELFERARTHGLETPPAPDAAPLRFDFVPLRANFRTAPSLVNDLNGHFDRIFAEDDGSGVRFSPAEAARESQSEARTELHLAFTLSARSSPANLPEADAETTRQSQLRAMIVLIQDKLKSADRARAAAQGDPHAKPEKYRIAVLGRTKNSLIRVAEALRKASIPFRAIELVPLRQRSEVVDALILARALLNPTDRTAWLGVLRAPWCGLSLDELHLLTSADEEEIRATPVPTLLESRLPRLFEQGRLQSRAFEAASRVKGILHSATETRASGGPRLAELGTWLESVWKALGGADTVNPEQLENLRLLWAALDSLPNGELDLLGPGLHAALDKLCATPDPAASSDFGVQLMTIHKSKGLEFEVVIVPDLEAKASKSEPKMISWLERGLADSEPGDEAAPLTEFLIAPIQAKGAEAGAAKSWVESVKRERETQELRRLLYVAATRAREELHLFARPRFAVNQASGEALLAKPTGLLATAWAAFREQVEVEFASWLATSAAQDSATLKLETLAAEAGSQISAGNLLQMPPTPTSAKPTILRRLPEGYTAPGFPRWSTSPAAHEYLGAQQDEEGLAGQNPATPLYSRTEGGLQSRLLGTAIHALLEELSRLRRNLDPRDASQALAYSLPAVTAKIRSSGLPRAQAERLADEALTVARQTSIHPVGAWILTAHPEAAAESRWTALAKQGPASPMWNLRPDRVFFAPADSIIESLIESFAPETPPTPASANQPAWWIIDYKTSHASGADLQNFSERQSFLSAHRQQHLGQLAAYAQVLRSLRQQPNGETLRIRAGIFYPRLQILDHWEA